MHRIPLALLGFAGVAVAQSPYQGFLFNWDRPTVGGHVDLVTRRTPALARCQPAARPYSLPAGLASPPSTFGSIYGTAGIASATDRAVARGARADRGGGRSVGVPGTAGCARGLCRRR